MGADTFETALEELLDTYVPIDGKEAVISTMELKVAALREELASEAADRAE